MVKNVYNLNMEDTDRPEERLVNLNQVGYITLLVVGLVGLAGMPEGGSRILAFLLLALIGIIMYKFGDLHTPSTDVRFYFGVQTLLVAGLLLMKGSWGMFPILYFMLSAQAMIAMPVRQGIGWIILFALITGVTSMKDTGWLGGALASLGYGTGFLFFGVFGFTLSQSEEERRRSEALLRELEIAHQQLQDYVLRVEELAVAEERNRLAREMHDAIGHRLTVAAVQLEGAQRLVSKEPEKAAGMVETVRQQVREALGELRQTVATLRQPLEMGLNIEQALERLVSSFEQGTGLPVNVIVSGEMPALAASTRTAIYRIAQEALTNVQRHAEASQVWVNLDCRNGKVILIIGDDGIGTRNTENNKGFGLLGIQERANQLGGEFDLEERPGGGAQISVRFPLESEEADGK